MPTESFFNFFSPPAPPSEEDEEDPDFDIGSEIEERLELDYQLGEDIKEKLIPHAIDWFTGEALRFEEHDDGDMEGDEFDDEDDEEDDLSDDQDEEDDSDDDVSWYMPGIQRLKLTCHRMSPESPNRKLLSASRAK